MASNRFCKILPILTMETIEGQTTSQINFNKYEVRSTGSNNRERMCYMEFGVNTKYVFGLPKSTQIGLSKGL